MEKFISQTNIISLNSLVKFLESEYIDFPLTLIKQQNAKSRIEYTQIIEKIMLGLPLSPIFLGENNWGKKIIISGNIIIQSIISFMHGELVIKDPYYNEKLKNLSFNDCSFSERRMFLEANLNIITYFGEINPLERCMIYREANIISGNNIINLEQKVRALCFETANLILGDISKSFNRYLIDILNFERLTAMRLSSRSCVLLFITLYAYFENLANLDWDLATFKIKNEIMYKFDTVPNFIGISSSDDIPNFIENKLIKCKQIQNLLHQRKIDTILTSKNEKDIFSNLANRLTYNDK